MRSSASECTSSSAPGGLQAEPAAGRSPSSAAGTRSSGRMTMKKTRTGGDDEQRRALGVAERDSLRDELADDDVQEGEDQIGEHDGEHGRRGIRRTACDSACSPSAPMPSEVSVTPSCIAAMKCGGSDVMRSTSRARRLPWWCSSTMRVRRAVTRPYSAATKKAFSRIRTPTRDELEEDRHAPTPWALVLGGMSSSN